MYRITLTILIFISSTFLLYSQNEKQEIIDSVFTYSDSPSDLKLKMINNCEYAKIIADNDIKNQNVKILIVGGISPVKYSTDTDFEKKYQITYTDFGDLPAKDECMRNYNFTVFDYLTEKFGKKWIRVVRKDVVGLKKWKKKKNK